MTTDQVATNATVLRGLADVLTRWGLADEHDRAAWIANYLHREGWRHIEAVPALRPAGPIASEAVRAEAKRHVADAVAAVRAQRTTVNPPNEESQP